MTWRVPPYDRAAEELVAYVRATYAPLGILITGSIVRGEAGPTSDLDVMIVHDQPWRLREQKRFHGVPAELFVNPAHKVRDYFSTEHAAGRPCTAHMFATGEVIEPSAPILHELVTEARHWLAKPQAPPVEDLTRRRYGAVDSLDDARDAIDHDVASAELLLTAVVRDVIGYAFASRNLEQPRRKRAVSSLRAIDPDAADLIDTWLASRGREALEAVEQLARHVLGVDTFFEWTSSRDPVKPVQT